MIDVVTMILLYCEWQMGAERIKKCVLGPDSQLTAREDEALAGRIRTFVGAEDALFFRGCNMQLCLDEDHIP